MSSATAVRTHSEHRVGNVYEGLDEIPNLVEPALGEQPDAGGDDSWKVFQAGLLAEVKKSETQMRFAQLAEELEDAAAGLSATRRAMRLPAFNEILALGEDVVPDVIERLKTSDNRPLWLRVLGTLTPFPPGAGEETVDDAADAWIQWGRLAS